MSKPSLVFVKGARLDYLTNAAAIVALSERNSELIREQATVSLTPTDRAVFDVLLKEKRDELAAQRLHADLNQPETTPEEAVFDEEYQDYSDSGETVNN